MASTSKRQRNVSENEDIDTESSEDIELSEMPRRPSKRYSCLCLRCNGKLVSFQTKKAHQAIMEALDTPAMQTRSKKKKNVYEEYQTPYNLDLNDNVELEPVADSSPIFPQKRNKHFKPVQSLQAIDPDITEIDLRGERNDIEDNDEDDEMNGRHSNFDPLFNEENGDSINQFTAPTWHQDSDTYEEGNIDGDYAWIVLWILQYQNRYQISETAIDSLMKFMRIILIEADNIRYQDFPTSLYTAKRHLHIPKPHIPFAACPKCHKLALVDDIRTFKLNGQPSIKQCNGAEFPNHQNPQKRKPCQEPLARSIQTENGLIFRPRMLYPRPSIKSQLNMFYQRPGFEKMLAKSGIRYFKEHCYTDVYDGRVWKSFKDQENSDTFFFSQTTATTHLGLLLNLDWFQPFTYTQWSTGAIYASILNLPREERNKPENMLYLGFLPGPKEVSLHEINHYLAPIVDELLEIWNGYHISGTYEHREGLNIRAAIIVSSNDTPAARKICGHAGSGKKCHRCLKRTRNSEGKNHYGGFNDIDTWNTLASPIVHREAAEAWKECVTNKQRETIFNEFGVRWSELLRLPYFDPIRFIVIDPMHCLFIGIAKWIVRTLWIDNGILTREQLRIIQKRMDEIDLPPDIPRIPNKVALGEHGFSNLTADQWKTFIMIYATPCMWDMLGNKDRQILGNFVRACTLLVSRIIEEDDLVEAERRLLIMSQLIEEVYGPENITSNIHLSLHIPDICRDYGPTYAYWLFAYERMNGILGKYIVHWFKRVKRKQLNFTFHIL